MVSYPLVNCHITLENHHLLWVNHWKKCAIFDGAMLQITRGYIVGCLTMVSLLVLDSNFAGKIVEKVAVLMFPSFRRAVFTALWQFDFSCHTKSWWPEQRLERTMVNKFYSWLSIYPFPSIFLHDGIDIPNTQVLDSSAKNWRPQVGNWTHWVGLGLHILHIWFRSNDIGHRPKLSYFWGKTLHHWCSMHWTCPRSGTVPPLPSGRFSDASWARLRDPLAMKRG